MKNPTRRFLPFLLALTASCAQLPPAQVARAPLAERCAALDALDTAGAAAAIGYDPVVFASIHKATGKKHSEICAMPNDEAAAIMLAERNKQRVPENKKLKMAAPDWVRTWDLDENGRLPTSTQFLAAEAQRARLRGETARRGGRGEAVVAQGAGLSSTQWTEIGPDNIGGRLRAVVIDPRNQNRIYIGAATGGVWLTEDAGQSYRPLTETLANLSIGSLAMTPQNPDVLYAGTGENFAGFAGMGIFKSTNGGQSWTFLNSTSTDAAVNPLAGEWGAVNRIVVSPADPNLLLAATARVSSRVQGAIMRSTDGGNSWTRILLAPGTVASGTNTNFGNANPPTPMDVQFDPNNPNNVLAGTANGHVYYSRDAGVTWTQTPALVTQLKGRGTSARAEIAWARTRPGTVYISLDHTPESSGARGQVWRSDDAGQTWVPLAAPLHLGEQGEYDNAIWVDPTNENHLIVGGLDLYQSQDGGNNFSKISDWRFATPGARQPHADHHQIVSVPGFGPGNLVVYVGNDGGLYRANNVFAVSADPSNTAWQNLNNGLNVTQFYGGAGSRAAGGRIIGGTQDNGALELNQGLNWVRTAGGDGGYAAVDPIDDTTIYGEYVYASIHRKVGSGVRQYICNGITEALKNEGSTVYCGADATEATNFISPFILDPNDRNRMLVGANSLWVSNNVRSTPPSWAAIKPPIGTKADGRFISAIAVAARDSNVIYVGHNTTGAIFKTTDGLSPTPTWTQVDSAQQPAATVTRLTIDPDNPNRVWATFSGFSAGRVWVTNDGGATWTNIHNNLPNVTMHDIKRHPTQPNWLYVGAANGVYTSENGGQSWSATNDGPNGVRVRELFWYDPSTLIAATYGRGMFKATVSAGGAANYTDLWWAGQAENGWGVTINQHGNTQFNILFVYDNAGKPAWYVMPGCTWNSDFTACNGVLYKPTSAPLDNYNTAQFVVGPQVGSVTFQYTGPNTALMQYVINGVAGQKNIMRQVFGAVDNTPGLQVGDMWWAGEAQNGWGISITQQYRSLFAAWYTYDKAGAATWFVMPAGAWSGNTYSGKLYSTTGSAWVGATYNPNQLQVTEVGTLTFNFASANSATMTYSFTAGPFAGTTQTKNIVRQPF
jgi:photosystem II stability/assembly factor-like uncharacterized protein